MPSHQWSLELLYLNMHIWIWHYWGCWINDDFMIHSGFIKFHIWLVSADLGKSFVPLWGLVELHQQLLTWHQLWWGIPPVLHVCNTACNKFITYHQFFFAICPIRKCTCAIGTGIMRMHWLGGPVVAFQQDEKKCDQCVHFTCEKKCMCLVMSKTNLDPFWSVCYQPLGLWRWLGEKLSADFGGADLFATISWIWRRVAHRQRSPGLASILKSVVMKI